MCCAMSLKTCGVGLVWDLCTTTPNTLLQLGATSGFKMIMGTRAGWIQKESQIMRKNEGSATCELYRPGAQVQIYSIHLYECLSVPPEYRAAALLIEQGH